MFLFKSKPQTKEEYLAKLSEEKRKQLMFKGYVFEVTTVSGYIHVLKPYYIRGHYDEDKRLAVLKDGTDVCYSNKNIEISTKHIESMKELKEENVYHIGKKAWKEISFKIMGETVSFTTIIMEDYLFELLAMDK